MKTSLVLPIYNEQEILQEVLAKYKSELEEIAKETNGTYEIIAVNDGCTDTSVDILMAEAKKNRSLRIINFDDRYGKQAAVTAGMEAATGDVVILADIDLLNPVGVITNLVQEYQNGSNIVYAYREAIGREKMRRRVGGFFIRGASLLFDIDGEYTGKANISLFSRHAADVLVALPNKNKFLRTMDHWVGFEIKKFEFASEYSKTEITQKVRKAQAKKRAEGCPTMRREKSREHTPSKIYGVCALIMTLLFIGTWIALEVFTDGLGVIWALVFIIAIACALLSTGLFFLRALMVKRIGLIYSEEDMLYIIESVVN